MIVYTVEEVATKLKISEPQVRTLVRKGKMGCMRVGFGTKAPIRVTEEQLQEYIKNSTINAVA